MHSAAEPRATNRSAVLSTLLSGRTLERGQIVEGTGLSRATVFRIVDDLRSRGHARDVATQPAGGRGRPSTLVRFDGSAHLVGCVDLGGTNCRFAVADALGNLLVRARHPTPLALDGERLAGWIAERVHELADAVPGEHGPLGAVTVGVPGVVSGDRSRVVGSHNLPQLRGTAFVDALRERVAVPATLDNDSKLALVGELQYGALAEKETAVLLTLGTGLGSAAAMNGQVLSGRDGLLGEFGRLLIPGTGTRLRDLVSGAGLVAHARAAGHDVTHARQVLEQPERFGDLRQRVGEALVHLVSIVALAYEPRTVIVTGGFAEGLADAALAEVQSAVLDVAGVRTRVRRTALGGQAGLLGALAVALGDLYASLGVLEEHISEIEVDRARVVKSLEEAAVHHG
ncbi:ROK family protein [Nonomuraea sp. NN258]|uniref:ROK family transcriptional regulator n=1 Tax=Nonomuraea antri TaxID=2730852 RepID=UPI001567FCCE|nr:ROK family protein [Nonomuraea antri]NRQ37070.1 ROK family protein [Nonomuraea antri]